MANGNGLDAAYLIVGEDTLKQKAMRKRLERRLEQTGALDMNYEVFAGAGASADDIVNACNTLPFASDTRLVVVESCDRLPKEGQNLIARYLENPCETTVLCLLADKLPATTALYKAVANINKRAIIKCDVEKKRELPARVAKMAETYGVSIQPQAANRLVELIGEDPIHLDAEVRKLATVLGKQGTITKDLVEGMVTRTAEAKPWELTDALATRDVRRVMGVLSRLDVSEPLGILSLCVRRIKELLTARVMFDDGITSTTELANKLGRKEWQVKSLFTWAQQFSSEELETALIEAAWTEMACKSGGEPQAVFTEWLIGVCTGSYTRPALSRR